ncbi:MAG: TIGR00282 family metallophosphoesterase [Verrucomicrobiales bacterium]|jgi:metallophosphoesterase (TIGR00282 family)|nr:TIGR00282 family metallophosphoesterase [Verrucomicrobiales bacterium]
MRVVFLGDVVGEPGRETVKAAAPLLLEKFAPDFLVVNGENAAGGHGITPRLVYELLRCKVDVITLGDHAWDQREILPFFAQEPRLVRPFNFPAGCPGAGWVTVSGNGKKLGVISALGRTFMPAPVDNPVLGLPAVLEQARRETKCILVDFHAETTSEKIAFGLAVDGQVSAVFGTHTHVQTADEKILPGGTAYLTDAGFCGGHDSVIGRDKGPILERYRTLLPVKMTVSAAQPQADGVFVEIDEETGKALRVERIQQKVSADDAD